MNFLTIFWTTTKYLCARLDAFDMWALRKILRIPYTRHITNDEVRSRSNCPVSYTHLTLPTILRV